MRCNINIETLSCPNCGGNVGIDYKVCKYCEQIIYINAFESASKMTTPQLNKYVSAYKKMIKQGHKTLEVLSAVSICYLRLGLYDFALKELEKVVNEDVEEDILYFYLAIAMLKGQKPFLHQRETIDKVLEYLNACVMLEPKGIYYFFLAYIKHDYFERKYFMTTPTYSDYLNDAREMGCNSEEVENLFQLLNQECPDELL